MTVQTLEQNTGLTAKPFVVKESDLDIFSCEELPPTPRTQRCIPEPDESFDISNFEISQSKSSRRYSTCSSSTSSSNTTSSSSSSTGSKSIASDFGELSSIASTPDTRRSRRTPRRLASTRKKPKKGVHFHNRINFCRIPHRSQLSVEDITHRWYRESELIAIKSDSVETIRIAKEHGVDTFLDDSEHSVRGLYFSKKQQRRSRAMARSCVLDEQNRQAREGVDDPENLALIYRSFAFASEETAQVNGRQDADVARRLR
jgi:hypothetical protein